MSQWRLFAAAGALLLPMASGARAADMPKYDLPPPAVSEPSAFEHVASGWYLRGDLGSRWNETTGASFGPALVGPTSNKIGSSLTAGIGVGVKTRWARTDVTLDYAFPADYKGTLFSPDDITAKVGATTALFNGYIDLGTWYGLTPYIGAGAGAAFARVTDYVRPVVPFTGSSSHMQTNFAYALMGGVAWAVAPNMQIDVGYRYLNIGDVKTASDGLGDMTIRNVAAHEVRVGVRWSFDDLRIR